VDLDLVVVVVVVPDLVIVVDLAPETVTTVVIVLDAINFFPISIVIVL
jgi:hypothetical protein